MAAKGPPRNPGQRPASRAGGQPTALNDLLAGIVDPVLRRRAGISLSLVQSWAEVVGPFAAERSRPEKVAWPRTGGRDAAGAATLVIACEASAALELQHETGEIIARVNAFLGLRAIGKIRLVQKPVAAAAPARRPDPLPLDAGSMAEIARMTAPIEDAGLRAALERLGASVKGSRRPLKSP